VKAASDLGGRAAFRQYRLREWAHTLSCVGHWLSKCPHRSTTFGAWRPARQDYQAARPGKSGTKGLVTGHWEYSGTGHRSDGDTWLAESYQRARRLNRRTRYFKESAYTTACQYVGPREGQVTVAPWAERWLGLPGKRAATVARDA
jgi:Replication initiator protein, pSAM2